MAEVIGVYVTSVAARILAMHPQTLRKYERVGFIVPSRSGGMHRLYSEADISRLKMIKYLVDDLGLNLAGVELALSLRSALLKLDQAMAEDENVDVDDARAAIQEMLHLLGA